MLRILRPDLLCGLGGFVLGAVALLFMHPTAPSPAPAPHTDILALVTAPPAPHHARRDAS